MPEMRVAPDSAPLAVTFGLYLLLSIELMIASICIESGGDYMKSGVGMGAVSVRQVPGEPRVAVVNRTGSKAVPSRCRLRRKSLSCPTHESGFTAKTKVGVELILRRMPCPSVKRRLKTIGTLEPSP